MRKTKKRYEVRRVGSKANFMWVVFKMLPGGKEIWWFAHPSLEVCLDPEYNYPTAKVVWSNPEDEKYTIEGFLSDPNCRLVKA